MGLINLHVCTELNMTGRSWARLNKYGTASWHALAGPCALSLLVHSSDYTLEPEAPCFVDWSAVGVVLADCWLYPNTAILSHWIYGLCAIKKTKNLYVHRLDPSCTGSALTRKSYKSGKVSISNLYSLYKQQRSVSVRPTL